jgi:hypothetical protein
MGKLDFGNLAKNPAGKAKNQHQGASSLLHPSFVEYHGLYYKSKHMTNSRPTK